MKKKSFIIVILLLSVVFMSTFFFKIIPVPVENIDGASNPNIFIYGGLYLTSGLQELVLHNVPASISYFLIFVVAYGSLTGIYVADKKR